MASQLPKRSRPHAAAGPSRARPPRGRLAPREQHGATASAAPVSRLLRFTRHGIPGLAVLAGVIAMAIGTTTSLVGGSALVGAGVASWLIAWLYRIGVEGDATREAEERARRAFDRTGRWPDA